MDARRDRTPTPWRLLGHRARTHAGAGFLYGLTQDGSGPADSLLQPIAPTLFRGGGARLSGDGWIGDGYTAGSGYSARITSARNHARRCRGRRPPESH